MVQNSHCCLRGLQCSKWIDERCRWWDQVKPDRIIINAKVIKISSVELKDEMKEISVVNSITVKINEKLIGKISDSSVLLPSTYIGRHFVKIFSILMI